MSYYNSTNTTVMATHETKGDNTRMILLHERGDGSYEYIIGSYFKVEVELGDPYDKNGPAFIDHYSWDWGHYFDDGMDAANYWNNEVLGEER